MRYGSRRARVILDRECWGTNIKKVYSIARTLDVQFRHKTPNRSGKIKPLDDGLVAVIHNEVWSMHQMNNKLPVGNRLLVLNVIDMFSRLMFRRRISATATRTWSRRLIACAGKSLHAVPGSKFRRLSAKLHCFQRPAGLGPRVIYLNFLMS